eukprot:381866-Ditylum_brightwellii.AAC.1
MSIGASALAVNALYQHQTSMIQKQIQQQVFQQLAYQAPQVNVAPAPNSTVVAEAQAHTSPQATSLVRKATEVATPTAPSTNSVIFLYVQHHAENVMHNLDQTIEEAKAAAK